MATKIQLRRDLAASWTSSNPILAQGEPGLETDTGKIKYGTGTTAWVDLEYAAGGDLVNGNLSVERNILGTRSTSSVSDHNGYIYFDSPTRLADGNVLLTGGFYSQQAYDDNGWNDIPVITKVDTDGNYIWTKALTNDNTGQSHYGVGSAVNTNTGNIVVLSTQYRYEFGHYAPLRTDIDANLNISTTIIDLGNWSYGHDIVTGPDGNVLILAQNDNESTVFSNVQAVLGSTYYWLGLPLSTFANTAPPNNDGSWYITGYDIGSETQITAVNDWENVTPYSSTSGDGHDATFTITNTPGSAVYNIALYSGGSSYLHNDTITILGNQVGGNITTNDITITVGNVNGGGSILDFTYTGTAQTNWIWLHEVGGTDFGQTLPSGEQWNVKQYQNTNTLLITDAWTKSIGGGGNDYMQTVHSDGTNIYVGGRYYSDYSTRDNKTGVVAKLDRHGVRQWARIIDFDHDCQVTGIVTDATGNVIVTTQTNNGYLQVSKLNGTTGASYWNTLIGTNGSYSDPMGFNSIGNPIVDSTGNIAIVSSFGSITSNGEDLLVVKLDANGNALWQRSISSLDNENIQWEDSTRNTIIDGDHYLTTFYDNNIDDTSSMRLPLDGSGVGVELDSRFEYLEQNWLVYQQSNPSTLDFTNDFGCVDDTVTLAVDSTSALVDPTGYLTQTTTNLYGSIGGHITGIQTLNFEDGTTQNSAAITPRSTFVGDNYYTMNIRVYNGGLNFHWDGNNDVLWFDTALAPGAIEGLWATGAIVEYQLYDNNNYGTQIGTIHLSSFYGQSGEAAHTEHWTSNNQNMMYNQPWILNNNYNRGRLYYRGQSGASDYIKIQWTARVFYGQENYC